MRKPSAKISVACFGNASDQSSFSRAPVPETSAIVQGMLTMPLAPSNSMIPVLAVDCLVAARNSLMDVAPGYQALWKIPQTFLPLGFPGLNRTRKPW
ncbi:hypothetical protein GCM10010987_27480 [Bradyrhizobium guangdongense]|uniref:Uncharacterized protein n=1 Tax=Bradyrhizobium guangdongense TaxID=1325090 RepID=A0AA88B862_9BRAD|nr:hypothetical protein GCM10010987_27480 [Bradyrhizobium guangdongense]